MVRLWKSFGLDVYQFEEVALSVSYCTVVSAYEQDLGGGGEKNTAEKMDV